MNNYDNYKEYDWEDEIKDEGSDFVLLPEDDYDFRIKCFERARYSGSDKIPPCNLAKVTFIIYGAEETVEITDNFYLYSKFEWKLSSLFLAIGLKKRNEPVKMNWNKITGATGKCRVYVDTYVKKDGSQGKSNKIKRLYPYDKEVETVGPLRPVPPAPAQATNWIPGDF
ncbi:MAG: hypothetical protein LUF33_08415 [Clostridiales bacterium]|nr:hypothetical protein [Clostridiales bacterium]